MSNLRNLGGGSGQNRLYLNDGKELFSDATVGRIPALREFTYMIDLGDVDGDGDLDIVEATLNQNHLLLNDGKGKFSDATVGSLPKDTVWTSALSFADVDGYRDLDLLLGNSVQNMRWLNNGKGVFTDATLAHMPVDKEFTVAVAIVDVDQDGDLDFYAGNSALSSITPASPDKLYLNDGNGKFSDATARLLPKDTEHTQGVVAADMDLDGAVDLVLLSSVFPLFRPHYRYYANDGEGRFHDLAADRITPPSSLLAVWSIAGGDVDRDGDIDLSLVSSGQDRLLINHHRQLYAPSEPRLGRGYRLELTVEPGYARGFRLGLQCFSAAERSPKLQRFGTFGLDLASLGLWGLVVVHPVLRKTTMELRVPDDARLLGMRSCFQALVIDSLAVQPSTWRFTNVVAETIR
ncbi:MAG: FG-GAP repeat domain-containing protein [Planctomycetota bacterium]